jgi:large subunit ribosomal protein L1
MPNPRLGTVTMDVAEAVRNAKAGQVRYRTDKNGIVHGGIGKVGFEPAAIKENIEALIADLKKAKPTTAKGTYVKKVVLSTTMGAGIPIDQASLEV